MVNNVQTAAEWGQVIENLDLMKKSALTQLSGTKTTLESLQSQNLTLKQQLAAADLAGDTALMAVIQGKIDYNNNRISGTQLAISNIQKDIAAYDTDLNDAFKQQGLAEAGPPDALSTTPPASGGVGDPTTVTLPAPETSIVTSPENTTFYENNGTASTSVPDTNTIVDDGSDPFVSNGQTTIQTIEPQANVDDGSDPYVSNGQTTIETIQPQQNADDGSDPYVSNGQSTIPAPAPGQFTLSESNARALSAAKEELRGQKTSQDQSNTAALGDWRVKLSLAPGAEYLYAGPNPGILLPLKQTGGVIFPYTPSISVNYAASYAATDPVHSNYKIYQYTSSSVDNIQISCVFTAQDTADANYLLAVIHFFRSVTKMFYGQDQNPINGTPPPLCYLSGMGAFQFDRHPLAITSFNYSLPTDVDYIQTGNADSLAGVNRQQTGNDTVTRYNQTLIDVGGNPPPPAWRNAPTGAVEPTYVPTKISLSISAVPVVSRNDISNRFSLNEYGAGNLLRGSRNNGAGIW